MQTAFGIQSSRSQRADPVTAACDVFDATMTRVEKDLLRAGASVPALRDKEVVASALWDLVTRASATLSVDDHEAIRHVSKRLLERAGKWLFRSRLWSHAFWKPHGYTGDFRMLEWMYDLEARSGDDPTQSAIANCLDYSLTTVHSVVAVWERRRWFRELLSREYQRTGGTLRVLDIACGGARYHRDFLSGSPSAKGVSLTLVDQDVAALAFCRIESLAPWWDQVRTVGKPLKLLPDLLGDETFDVVIASGVYDYFDRDHARHFTTYLSTRVRPGGVVALSNFHPDDESRWVKALLVQWFLIFKTEEELANLFPRTMRVETSRSQNRALAYALARA
jgi:SAM-dependent methyltransferase